MSIKMWADKATSYEIACKSMFYNIVACLFYIRILETRNILLREFMSLNCGSLLLKKIKTGSLQRDGAIISDIQKYSNTDGESFSCLMTT